MHLSFLGMAQLMIWTIEYITDVSFVIDSNREHIDLILLMEYFQIFSSISKEVNLERKTTVVVRVKTRPAGNNRVRTWDETLDLNFFST